MGRKVWVPVVSGPLAPYAAEFASWLASRAYSPKAAAGRLYQFDQLSRWLERERLGVGALCAPRTAVPTSRTEARAQPAPAALPRLVPIPPLQHPI